MAEKLDEIIAEKADCNAFRTGFCWITRNPYYTGHHRTKRKAIEAAKRKKLKMKRR